MKSSNTFNNITGMYHNYPEYNITQYTFNYDTSRCPSEVRGVKILHNCAFLIVMYTENKARY